MFIYFASNLLDCYLIVFLYFPGECWSGATGHVTYAKDGPSQHCLTRNFQKCLPTSDLCIGEDHTNYVYKVTPSRFAEKFQHISSHEGKDFANYHCPFHFISPHSQSLLSFSFSSVILRGITWHLASSRVGHVLFDLDFWLRKRQSSPVSILFIQDSVV